MNEEKHQAAASIEASQAVQMLRLKMAVIETEREVFLKDGMSAADASLFASCRALSAVSEMLLGLSIESQPINRVLVELSDIVSGSRPTDMLAFRGSKGRPRERAMVEELKGHLAAITEYRQECGSTRRAATEWVGRHLSKPIQAALRNPKPRTIDSWLLNFGGDCGDGGRGRHGYVEMREKLREKPSEQTLINWIHHLERYLPPRAESD